MVAAMATALALVAAAIFSLSTVLQQRGGLDAPSLSLRHPLSFVHLAGQRMWLLGMALLIPGWVLQAMALDRGRVAVIQPIFTMSIVFVLPLGKWLTAQVVTLAQTLEAIVVVVGLSVFIILGDAAGGRSDAPNSQWFVSIAVIAMICGILLPFGGKSNLLLRAGCYGAVAGILDGLAATLVKPTLDLLHAGGLGAVFGDWKVYVVGISGLLGIVIQQIGLQTGRLAPTVATGSVTEPLLCVILGIVLLQERLAPPTWHKVVAFAGLGLALAAAVAISIARDDAKEVTQSLESADSTATA
jgi:uncharacterized membrane protein